MKRRQLIVNTAIGTASAATVGACKARTNATGQGGTQPNVRWRMATSWPKALGIYKGADTLSQRIRDMTNGRFTITPFAAGELVPGLQVLDAVQAGTVECGHTASYYYVGKNPAFAFATSIPFGLTAQQQNAWFYQGGGLEAMQKLYADFNIINFPAGNSGAQMGGWFKRQINSVADLNGLKMRIPGLGGQVMSRLGVNVQVLPGGEIYLALDRGAIDAAEWVGPYDDEKLGLNKAAQFYYYPGWWEPGPSWEVLVNRTAWNRLPKEYQQIFQTAAVETNTTNLAQYNAWNGEALERIVKGGAKLTPYSKEIMQAAQKATTDLLAENANKDPNFKQIYQQWDGFRQQIYRWNRINELSFANFAFSS